MTQAASYRQALKYAEEEIRGHFDGLVNDLQYLDATTLVGRLLPPKTATSERLLYVAYDADSGDRALVAGTAEGARPVNPQKAVPFILRAAGGAVAGCALTVAPSGEIGSRVHFPLLGDDPYPPVPEPIVRWMTGQAIRSGALVEAITQFTSLCDAGMAPEKAAEICKEGFGPYEPLLGQTKAWQVILGGTGR